MKNKIFQATLQKSAYFPALTGLRAVAAFLVFFSHNPLPAKRVGIFINAFFSELYIGVNIFFVLSGFLITLRYQDQVKLAGTNFLSYLKNRFARIYPMYFILTTFTFIYYRFEQPDILFNYLMNITFLRGFSEKLIATGIVQGWTLTVEECFYFLAPLIFFLNRKIKAIWLILVFYLIGIILVNIFRHPPLGGFFESYQFMFIKTFFGRCFEFFVGIALAKLYKSPHTNFFLKRNCTLLGSIGIFVTVLLLILSRDPAAQYQLGVYSTIGAFINNLLLPVSIAIFMWGLLHEQTMLRKLLETNTFILLGKASYTFYLIHVGFIADFIRLNITHNYLYNFPILVIISIVLFKTIEEPMNRYIRSLHFRSPVVSAKSK